MAPDSADVAFLKAVSFLKLLPRERLAMLAESGTRRVFRAGTVFISQGTVQSTMHVILKGRVEIARSHPQFLRSVVLAELKDGDSVGEIHLFDGLPQPLTAVAVEDTETLELSAEALTDAMRGAVGDFRDMVRRLRWRSCSSYAFDRSANPVQMLLDACNGYQSSPQPGIVREEAERS